MKIGEPVCDVIARFFPNKTEGEIYCGGGAFFAHPVRNGEVVVDTTSAIFISEKVGYSNEKRCIGCGACTYVCAAGKDTREVVRCLKQELLH